MHHTAVERLWGRYVVMDEGPGFNLDYAAKFDGFMDNYLI
jgi:hypothetical protein